MKQLTQWKKNMIILYVHKIQKRKVLNIRLNRKFKTQILTQTIKQKKQKKNKKKKKKKQKKITLKKLKILKPNQNYKNKFLF